MFTDLKKVPGICKKKFANDFFKHEFGKQNHEILDSLRDSKYYTNLKKIMGSVD